MTASNAIARTRRNGRLPMLTRTPASFRPQSRIAASGTNAKSIPLNITNVRPLDREADRNEVHAFVSQLANRATEEAIGAIQRVILGIDDAEVVMRIQIATEFTDDDAMLSKVFRDLDDALASSEILNRGGAKNRSNWSFRIGNVIVDRGEF